ncbi:MAG: hypothetical protein IT521_05910 [Burkholderiales bacterium]|nr:hypothetical protein [Burkholderiales bacterium]
MPAALALPAHVPLTVVSRGGIVDSLHQGSVAVVDGSARGLHPATVAVLDQLGLVDAAAREMLMRWARPVLRNLRSIATREAFGFVVLDKLEAVSQPAAAASAE